MNVTSIKKLLPLSFRIWGRHTYNKLWADRRLNNEFFGFLFDLSGTIYKERGCSFEIPKDLTSRGFRSRFFFHSYETDDANLVEKFIQPQDAVLELGACIGFLACITNKKLTNSGHHVVVEANPLLIPWIERNKIRNNCSFRVEHCLVSDNSDGVFYIHDLIVSGSAVRKTGRSVKVPVKSVSAIFKDASPTAIIVNIEGGELDFLRQAKSLLGNVRLAIVDMHDFIIGKEACDECRRLLAEAGFCFVEKPASIEVWMRKH
jgi:FkbM family methyltransferase